MRRAALLIGLAFATMGPVAAWADDIQSIDAAQLHCSDWKKVAPHVWTQTGVIDADGHRYEGNTMDNTDQSRMLDMLCTS